jgi:hypothetical protein
LYFCTSKARKLRTSAPSATTRSPADTTAAFENSVPSTQLAGTDLAAQKKNQKKNPKKIRKKSTPKACTLCHCLFKNVGCTHSYRVQAKKSKKKS